MWRLASTKFLFAVLWIEYQFNLNLNFNFGGHLSVNNQLKFIMVRWTIMARERFLFEFVVAFICPIKSNDIDDMCGLCIILSLSACLLKRIIDWFVHKNASAKCRHRKRAKERQTHHYKHEFYCVRSRISIHKKALALNTCTHAVYRKSLICFSFQSSNVVAIETIYCCCGSAAVIVYENKTNSNAFSLYNSIEFYCYTRIQRVTLTNQRHGILCIRMWALNNRNVCECV